MINLTNTDIVPDRKTAVALGLFDGLHRGHRAVIQAALDCAAAGCEPAVFTFNTAADFPKRGAQGIITHTLKLAMLKELGISYVYTPDFAGMCAMEPEDFVEQVLLRRLNAGVAVCGEDFRFGRSAQGDSALLGRLCAARGIRLLIVPAVREGGVVISSTLIRELIAEGEIARANQLLGYEFTLLLEVVHGAQLGRTIGFPTINQDLDTNQLIPRLGVYASVTEIGGAEYPSVTNVGVKPTTGQIARPIAETYIIGYDGDLYGRTVPVRLRRFLRGEERFDSLERLKAQIEQDIILARREHHG